MFGVPKVAGIRHHDRSDRAQLCDDFSRLVEPTHMSVAGGEKAVRAWKARIVLDGKKQLRHGLIEAPGKEMRETD
jgi:hypothetical protein